MTPALIGIFWIMQVSANIAFKYGSMAPSRWWPGFIIGNIIGAASIFFMMKIYERMNVNIAMTIAGGGTFLLVQLIMAGLFKSRMNGWQWAGILAVAAGMMIAGLGSPRPVEQQEKKISSSKFQITNNNQ